MSVEASGMTDKHHFPYAAGHTGAFKAALSGERLQRYLDEAGGAESAALVLYTRNTAISAAFYGPLQACEIAVRNAVDAGLGRSYGREWFDNESIFRAGELRLAREARALVDRAGKTVTPGRIIAELGFGYWVGLFANAYDNTLWRGHLHRVFSPRPSRHDLYDRLNRLRTLRNRIAHHEPIFQRNLIEDYGRIHDVLNRLSQPVAEWVDHHSRVYDLLAASPEDIDRF